MKRAIPSIQEERVGTAIESRVPLPPEYPVEPFIDKPEVARRLKKTLRTVDNWMREGHLPYYKIGRSVAFRWSEVEQHLGQTCRVCRSSIK